MKKAGILIAAFVTLHQSTVYSYAANMPLAGNGGYFRIDVESYKESRFREVIRQNYDFSCGSAALATLLKYHYKYDVTEQEVLNKMYENGDQEKIKTKGFSLLDMKNYLSSIGINSDGYRASLDKLAMVGIPAIVLINSNGYMHFVVIKGVADDMVLVGDPAMGKRVLARKDFEKMWNGILFVVKDDKEVAMVSFNTSKGWKINEKAVFDAALNNSSLASFAVHTSPTPNYHF